MFSPAIKYKNIIKLINDNNEETQQNSQKYDIINSNKNNENLKTSNDEIMKNYFLPSFVQDIPGESLNGLISKEEAGLFKSYLGSILPIKQEIKKETFLESTHMNKHSGI